MLDTLFSDTLTSDLERLMRINDTLNMVDAKQRKTMALKTIDTLVIKPSEDLHQVASKHYQDIPIGVRVILQLLGISRESDSSIVSYVLFEQAYTRELIELGYCDGMNRLPELREFLQIPSTRGMVMPRGSGPCAPARESGPRAAKAADGGKDSGSQAEPQE